MKFTLEKNGFEDAAEGKPADPWKEVVIQESAPGSSIRSKTVRKTYDERYAADYMKGECERWRREAIANIKIEPLIIFPSKGCCPHCGKEL